MRAPEPLERALEPAERAGIEAQRGGGRLEGPGVSWKVRSYLGGPAKRHGDRGKRKQETEWIVPVMWWYHWSLSPTGPLPKERATNERSAHDAVVESRENR